jgi:sortase (surface protein transpeptidase)
MITPRRIADKMKVNRNIMTLIACIDIHNFKKRVLVYQKQMFNGYKL